MPISVNHAAGTAALASLDAAIAASTSTSARSTGARLRATLSSELASYRSRATEYNAAEAAGVPAAASAELQRVVTGAESEATRLALTYTPSGTTAQRATALEVIFRPYRFHHAALATAIRGTQIGEVDLPDDSAILALVSDVTSFVYFITAAV